MSSTEIMVTWDEIPGLDQNGIIIDYEVQIEQLDFPADIFVDLLNTTSLSILVIGLEEYVNYNISVRAYTSVGPGPYSDPVTERTLEDGNYTWTFHIKPQMIMCFPAYFHTVSTTHRTSHSSPECSGYCCRLNSDHGDLGGSPCN